MMSNANHFRLGVFVAVAPILFLLVGSALGQGTAFTYQGKLTDGGNVANGSYDMQFKLFDTMNTGTGTQQGSTITNGTVSVSSGIFSVTLDFGAAVFDGSARYLEIGVRSSGSSDPYTVLSPRQQINSSPYSIRSVSATAADGLSVACVNCVTSSQIQNVQGSQVNGEIPVASLPAGSGNYVQNQNASAQSADFKITGRGSANIFDASMQYNLGGGRVLGAAGSNNLFVGTGAGIFNSGDFDTFVGFSAGFNNTASFNTFVGDRAGVGNTTGGLNSFFGSAAGLSNVGGSHNSFFGTNAGTSNQNGSFNAFFGRNAGFSLNNADANAFFGAGAGENNTNGVDNSFFGASSGGNGGTGSNNSFFGREAGRNNTASGNSFFGRSAGFLNTTGTDNAFFGYQTGLSNTTETDNTFLGWNAGKNTGTGDTNPPNANFNTFVGSAAGLNNTTGNANSFFGAQAGNNSTTACCNSFFGTSAGGSNTTEGFNTFIGSGAGFANGFNDTNNLANFNTFVGADAGRYNGTGARNTALGQLAIMAPGTNLNNATVIGARAMVAQSNSMVLGSINGVNSATADTNVGIGTTAPQARLNVNGTSWFQGDTTPLSNQSGKGIAVGFGSIAYLFAFDYSAGQPQTLALNSPGGNVGIGTISPAAKLHVNGRIIFDDLGINGDLPLCRNSTHEIALCTSSSLRYKKNLTPFTGGLDILTRLRPIAFQWKNNDARDFGLAAEDVARVEPRLVVHNDKGQVEGVKYDRLNVILINAVNEQQREIEHLKTQLRSLRVAVRKHRCGGPR